MANAPIRPFFPYYGSKWNIARHYPAPTSGHVVEPFAGSAGYACFYAPQRVTLMDTDEHIAGVWDYLIRVTASEIDGLPLLPNAGDSVDDVPLAQEARWLIGFWLNRGSATPKRSRTRYSSGVESSHLVWSDRAKHRITSQLERIRGWTVRQASFAEAADDDATWFIDPPYGDKGKYYRHKFADYEGLARFALARRGQVIVCEGPGATWLPFRDLGSFKSTKGRATEVIWTREPCPEPQQSSMLFCK